MTIVHSLETHDDRLKLASDWSVSVDVLLTELKARSLFDLLFLISANTIIGKGKGSNSNITLYITW